MADTGRENSERTRELLTQLNELGQTSLAPPPDDKHGGHELADAVRDIRETAASLRDSILRQQTQVDTRPPSGIRPFPAQPAVVHRWPDAPPPPVRRTLPEPQASVPLVYAWPESPATPAQRELPEKEESEAKQRNAKTELDATPEKTRLWPEPPPAASRDAEADGAPVVHPWPGDAPPPDRMEMPAAAEHAPRTESPFKMPGELPTQMPQAGAASGDQERDRKLLDALDELTKAVKKLTDKMAEGAGNQAGGPQPDGRFVPTLGRQTQMQQQQQPARNTQNADANRQAAAQMAMAAMRSAGS